MSKTQQVIEVMSNNNRVKISKAKWGRNQSGMVGNTTEIIEDAGGGNRIVKWEVSKCDIVIGDEKR